MPLPPRLSCENPIKSTSIRTESAFLFLCARSEASSTGCCSCIAWLRAGQARAGGLWEQESLRMNLGPTTLQNATIEIMFLRRLKLAHAYPAPLEFRSTWRVCSHMNIIIGKEIVMNVVAPTCPCDGAWVVMLTDAPLPVKIIEHQSTPHSMVVLTKSKSTARNIAMEACDRLIKTMKLPTSKAWGLQRYFNFSRHGLSENPLREPHMCLLTCNDVHAVLPKVVILFSNIASNAD